MKKYIWILIGVVSLALGSVGIFLPILPTVPFYMLTAFAFAKGSTKLELWFKDTDLYKKHVKGFQESKGLSKAAKIKLLTVVTIVMGFGFFMMSRLFYPRIILFVVWICHLYYFIFRVKTLKLES